MGLVNSLRPSDAIWRQWSWATLAQVMACCLTAPSHYLNQCWLIIRGVLWHSSENSFAGIAQGINSGYEFKKDLWKLFSNLPGANELKKYFSSSIRRVNSIWVRSRNWGCLVTWFCYQLIAKPGNKTASVPWPDPYGSAIILILSVTSFQSLITSDSNEIISRWPNVHNYLPWGAVQPLGWKWVSWYTGGRV